MVLLGQTVYAEEIDMSGFDDTSTSSVSSSSNKVVRCDGWL